MSAIATSPTEISQAFWAMSNQFKTLTGDGDLTPNTPGVTAWNVQLLPAHEIVTFESTCDGHVSASWITTNADTKQPEFNEVLFSTKAFDLIFAGALRG